VDLGPDEVLCEGDAWLLDATIPGAIAYAWSDGSTDPTLTVTDPGTYWVTVSTADCTAQDTVVVDFIFLPDEIDLGGGITLCDGEEFLLDATTPGATYLWQDGSTDPTFLVTEGGSFQVSVFLGSCVAEGFFDAEVFPNPTVDLGPDLSICTGTVLFADATFPGATYTWQDGSNAPLYEVSAGGTFWVDVTLGGLCTVRDSITVTVVDLPNAGTGGTLTLCATAAPAGLFAALGGSPDPGGAWTSPGGAPSSGTFDPATDAPGTYTYTVSATGCPDASATVTVAVTAPPNAGSNAVLVRCTTDSPVDLLTTLGGSPDAGGAWTGPGGASVGATLDPASATGGTYTYTVAGTAPCPDASATVQVTLVPAANAGTDGSLVFCLGQAPTPLFPLLGGTPSAGGTWTSPAGTPFGGTFNPAIHAPGAYTYTVVGQPPCANATATVTVAVGQGPNAGPDVTSCGLSQALNATGNTTGGLWSGPPGVSFANPASPSTTVSATLPGTYTLVWTIDGSQGCGSTDTVLVTLVQSLAVVLSSTNAVCNGYCDGTANATVSGGTPPYAYAWSTGTPTDPGAASGLCAGLFGVLVTDANGCQQPAGGLITEPPPMAFTTLATTPETCTGACDGTIAAFAPGAVAYALAGGETRPDGLFAPLCPATYTLTATDPNGCFVSQPVVIDPAVPVEADFIWSPDPATVAASTVFFASTSSPNAVAFAWDFAGLGSSNAADPAFTFPDVLGDAYQVCLTVFDANDCPDTHCASVVIDDVPVAHVPNVFTPDGDGINDFFAPVFNLPGQVRDYRLTIYNRWGEQVFLSVDPTLPWTGATAGQAAPDGVYVWVLNYQEPTGQGRIEKRGHVTLLR
jgi:gliding motility-associated-like protein